MADTGVHLHDNGVRWLRDVRKRRGWQSGDELYMEHVNAAPAESNALHGGGAPRRTRRGRARIAGAIAADMHTGRWGGASAGAEAMDGRRDHARRRRRVVPCGQCGGRAAGDAGSACAGRKGGAGEAERTGGGGCGAGGSFCREGVPPDRAAELLRGGGGCREKQQHEATRRPDRGSLHA